MGMTDRQFSGFLRQIIRNLKRALATMQEGKEREILEELLEDLQNTLED